MIISCWQGFEIDSSEGYYAFEEGFSFLRRLLASPLLWHWISFALVPLEGRESLVKKYLTDQKKQRVIIEIIEEEYFRSDTEQAKEEYEYPRDFRYGLPASHRDPDYISTNKAFQAALQDLKYKVMLVSVNFLFRDLKKLPPHEYRKLREWFMEQHEDRGKAEFHWQTFESLELNTNPSDEALARGFASSRDDFVFMGISDYSDMYHAAEPLLGSFELYCKPPYSYRLLAYPNDPSFIVYLASTLLNHYAFEQYGMNSCDNSPPLLELRKGGVED